MQEKETGDGDEDWGEAAEGEVIKGGGVFESEKEEANIADDGGEASDDK